MNNSNSQVATQQPQSLQTIMGNAGVMAKLNSVLGNEKKAAAFASSVISVANGNSLLRNANPMTVLGSAMVAATLDLSVVPTLGMAYIVPYKGQASFQLGWKGLVELAMRSGQYKNIIVEAVHEGELVKKNKFTGDYEFDEDEIGEGRAFENVSNQPSRITCANISWRGLKKAFAEEEEKEHGCKTEK